MGSIGWVAWVRRGHEWLAWVHARIHGHVWHVWLAWVMVTRRHLHTVEGHRPSLGTMIASIVGKVSPLGIISSPAVARDPTLGSRVSLVILGGLQLSRLLHSVDLANSLTILAFNVVIVVCNRVHVDGIAGLAMDFLGLRGRATLSIVLRALLLTLALLVGCNH